MLFLHPWLLAGLAGVAIPIIIHLVRKQAAKPIDWGAMRFLFDTVAVRRRRIEWEDLLLMAARCLLLGLLALAIARPFVTPDSGVPWLFVLPAALLGIALFGGSFVIEGAKARWLARAAASLLVLTAAGLVVFEKMLNLRRFEAGGRRDVALVIDASSSMELERGGARVFDLVLEEARRIVTEAPRGTAFTLILGGPAPQALTRNPVTHRADVLEILESLQPVGGSFRAHEALGMATLVLAQGDNTQKEIIVITDSQRTGWRFDEPAAWRNLASAWDSLPAKPKVMLRNMGGPETFRNVMVSHPELSRPLVGTDREVLLRATVTNTGREPLAPGPVTLEIDGAPCGESSVGLLAAGQSETVEFSHRFTKRGPAVAVVRMDPKDDLASDDLAERVVNVRGGLPVLLVDGNPSVSFFERAAGYPALALAPSASLVKGDKPGDGFLMDPRVVAAGALTDEDLTDAAVIVLADVPRLPERLSNRIAERVSAGAGLFIIAGPRAESAFYNQWQGTDGPVCPAPLGEEVVDADGVQPAAATFRHEALKRFADAGDLSAATVRRWRKTGDPVEGAALAAALSSGDAFLTATAFGKGRVMLASCAFDARSGNLPARRSFVPLMHELVMWSAGGGVELNVSATWSPAAILGSNSGGLAGEYLRRKGGEKTRQPFRRVDPNIDFDWGSGKPDSALPSDGFSVRWTGFITAPTNGSYLFEAEADDRISLRIDGDEILTAEDGAKPQSRVTLKAGKPVSVDVQYEEDQGEARARLYWTPPGETRQVVPPSALMPGLYAELEKLVALDPRGIERPASLRAGRRGIEVSVDGAAVPGVYQVRGGEALKGAFDFGDASALPLVVNRDAGESVFEPMRDGDLELMRRHADILLPGNVEDVLAVLRGKGFGREIWKLLAVAALVLLVLESVLARWVSKSRGAAGSVEVDFGGSVAWRGGRR
jgi:hypothetical protein